MTKDPQICDKNARWDRTRLLKSVVSIVAKLLEAILSSSRYNHRNFSNDLAAQVERLSLEYETESSKQHRRLRNLFHVPFDHFDALKENVVAVTVGRFHTLLKP